MKKATIFVLIFILTIPLIVVLLVYIAVLMISFPFALFVARLYSTIEQQEVAKAIAETVLMRKLSDDEEVKKF